MDPNTHSTGPLDGLTGLATAVDALAAQDLAGLPDATRAERVLVLRRLLERLEGQWLRELAAVDARGAAGADQGVQAGSTAGWLRARLRMGAGAAASRVRTARALFRGPLTTTANALTAGELSPALATVLAHGIQDLPADTAAEAEPILVEAARRLDPPRLRRVAAHLRLVADPEVAEHQAERRHQQRGLWLSATLEGMVAVDGLLEPEAGQSLLTALEPLARPHSATDGRSAGQRRADALAELARRSLEGGRLPQTGGIRPQLIVTVELDSLLGRRDSLGGEAGWAGPLDPETCRRLACDSALTRVLVTRHPTGPSGEHPATRNPDRDDGFTARNLTGDGNLPARDPGEDGNLAARLRAAVKRLPPVLGGAPSQPLEVGRSSRVVQAAQRAALAVRDGGCVFPGCQRPQAWCEAHHLRHWLHGGPTDLANLALLCRTIIARSMRAAGGCGATPTAS
jgi:hypothetical protein